MKKGVAYANFGCNAHHSRGSAICANNQTVSERRAIEGVLGTLRGMFLDPEKLKAFIAEFQKRIDLAEVNAADDTAALDKKVRDAEREVEKLVDVLTKASWSDALAARLKEAEQHLAKLRAQATAASRQKPMGKIIVHPKRMETYLANLIALLERDAVNRREVLARHVRPMELTPAVEGRPPDLQAPRRLQPDVGPKLEDPGPEGVRGLEYSE